MTIEHPNNSLQQASIDVPHENPDLPMKLRYEVSSHEIVKNLLEIEDLTLPTDPDVPRNIIGRIHDNVMDTLDRHSFPNIQTVRGNPVVTAEDNFDRLLFSPGNPSRSSTYTRYVDGDHILRTHMSALIPSTLDQVTEDIDYTTFVLPGLVYRRDVIDPRHLDAFHQIDIWTLQDNETQGVADRERLLKLARVVFEAACPGAEMAIYEAEHPYTVDGIEVYAKVNGREIEVLEAGLAHPKVLRNSGINPDTHSGLALGMGVERLVMARKDLPDIRLIRSTDPRVISQMTNLDPFVSVSDQPALNRDMSFCIQKDDTEEDICERIRFAFGDQADLLEEVSILSRTMYEALPEVARERLGATPDQDNILARVTLRHPDKTLTKKEASGFYSTAYQQLHRGTTKGYGN